MVKAVDNYFYNLDETAAKALRYCLYCFFRYIFTQQNVFEQIYQVDRVIERLRIILYYCSLNLALGEFRNKATATLGAAFYLDSNDKAARCH